MNRRREIFILMLLIIVTIIWGLNVIMIKYLTAIFPIFQLNAWRISLAAICLLLCTFKFWSKSIRKISYSAWFIIFCIGFFAIYTHQLLITYGLTFTSSAEGALILALNPLTTSLLAMIFLGEHFEWKRFIGIGLGFFGVLIVIGRPNSAELHLWGDFIVFLSMLAYVIGGILIKKVVEEVDVFTVTTFSHTFATILLLGTWLVVEEPVVITPSVFPFFVLFVSGVVATALCTTWWNMGIQEIGPSRTTLFLNLLPLSSIIFAALLLKEVLQGVYFLSLIFIFAGIYLGVVKRKQPELHMPSKSV